MAYITNRRAIIDALVTLFKTIDGTGNFYTDLAENVYPRLMFFEELQRDLPAVCVVASDEAREYQSAGYADRYLWVKIIIFVDEENALNKLDLIMADLENLLDSNLYLTYTDRDSATQKTKNITIDSLSTDEGTLDPISIGEIKIRVHY